MDLIADFSSIPCDMNIVKTINYSLGVSLHFYIILKLGHDDLYKFPAVSINYRTH